LAEAEHWGGTGCQSAAVFDDGVVISARAQAEGEAINKALRILGVTKGGAVDECEDIGLPR
jgi:hypothetical protein